MGNRGSSNVSKPASKAPSGEEKKRTPVARKSPTPAPRNRDSSKNKTTPDKKLEKAVRRIESTQGSDQQPDAVTPLTPAAKKKSRDEPENRTAKELKKKKKSSGVYVDGVLVGAKKKPTSRTPSKTTSEERKKREERKGVAERTAKRGSNKRTEESVDRSADTGDEKTQDSSGKRRMRKSAEVAKSTEDVSNKKTETTEKTKEMTEKTKEDKAVPEGFGEDDNTLVSDPPKRKKYSDEKEENAKGFLKEMLGKGIKGLKEEFGELKKEIVPMRKDEVPEIYSEFAMAINVPKNRYKDVPRLNDSKVVLKDRNDNEGYVHANYCTTPKADKRFICTQGPNEATYNDFWSMIYQEEVEFIVMLCNFLEMGKPKCDKYFPLEEGEIMSTQDFTIQCMAVHGNKFPETVTIRKLTVTKKEDSKECAVQHVHWESWPDRGVPPIDHSIFKLLHRVGKSSKPIAVHCSAGIGRTGTTVMVQIVMEMISSGESLNGGLVPVLKKLRKQRAMSVQNDTQYVFIHRVLLEYFKDLVDDDEATQFCADYEKIPK